MGKGKRLREERAAEPQTPRTINTPAPIRTEKPSIAKRRRHDWNRGFREYRKLPPEVKAALLEEAEANEEPEEQHA